MRLPNFRKMPDKTLGAYKKAIDKELAARESREAKRKQRALEKLLREAEKAGISLKDLQAAGRNAPARKKRSVAKLKPKYLNPTDPSLTWSGRGHKPAWVREHLERGGKLEELAI